MKLIIGIIAILLISNNLCAKTKLKMKTKMRETVFNFIDNIINNEKEYKKQTAKAMFENNKEDNASNNETPSPSAHAQPAELSQSAGSNQSQNNDLSSKTITDFNSGNAKLQITPFNSKDIVDLNDPNVQLSDWFTIQSHAFGNTQKYPPITSDDDLKRGISTTTNSEETIRNNANFLFAKQEGSPDDNAFWFRARGGYIFYSSTKSDMNVLEAIYVKEILDNDNPSKIGNNTPSCFEIVDFSGIRFKLCAQSVNGKLKWLCSLQKYLNVSTKNYWCNATQSQINKLTQNQPTVELKTEVQNVIIIPQAAKNCNEKWNYISKGSDWECTCKEGMSQSPIDLPTKDTAELSPLRPMFVYDSVSAISEESTVDGILTKGEGVKIRYDKGAIRMYHANMGKIVTMDGEVYIAEEISFHTPSEHKISGEQFDLEMQVVHFGKSKGDIAKQVILTFLFKKTPGKYNKFLDKIDFFSLPNPLEIFRELEDDIFIPNVFYNTDDDDIPVMSPFSFYTYEGSITMPPCTERTIHYVMADPIPLSNTIITLFQEALRMPDIQYNSNKPDLNSEHKHLNTVIVKDEGIYENNRETQPLNGRTVYIFDHKRYGCAEFTNKKKKISSVGHYEKRIVDTEKFIFVSGNEPSGLLGAFMVSEDEAKGIQRPQI